MKLEVKGAPHIPAPRSVRGMMFDVLLALVPGIAAHVFFFGPGILIQLIIASAFALAFEAIMLKLRARPLHPFLSDLSAPLTAALYVLCLPPTMPWWTTLTGMFFAIVVAKHLYGGLGFNLFNPAMVGYAVVLICFPVQATSWLPPTGLESTPLGFTQLLHWIGFGYPPDPLAWDAVTGATPLDALRTGASEGVMITEIREQPIFGDFGGRGWEWIANFYAVGGLYLLYRRTISWHAPVAMLGTVIALSLPVYAMDAYANPFPLEHIFTGGIMLGAFFIVTDPVSGSTTPKGRILFGVGVAVLTLAIRRWGGFPDGVAFAVLLMNLAVPLLDRYTQPRVYGK